ncbi:asparagine synthase (glutamine-hydrolysing) [Lentibacillus halodurans]|uniref:asparagine synthase (glutamine-hydrolyzing) n=1 Tax=Lentibacillus halodurans TaxID=237679 RepID=A0A1I1AH94_9BACI|nr:asparagine synthase (glutamine-hydrolyzing) [Lentibacillus halodurans]SFB36862.1 asparagine synthase (glutamine-hydrolysing) [Lentibacillus halodurans]
MCGFVGKLSLESKQKDNSEKIYNALASIHHRGPDATGYYNDSYIQLGFKRLSIIDIECGDQPLSYENNRFHIVFNGEIYNYVELRESLVKQGFSFETHSDTEVILALYSSKKEGCLKALRGMFAFAIWDKQEKVLFAARDPFGIKPFYYLESDKAFLFASEKKCLTVYENDDDLSREAFQHYLTYQYVPESYCLKGNVHKLKPGHFLFKKPGSKIDIQTYYHKNFRPSNEHFSHYVEKTGKVLDDSVAKHLRSDVPTGAFLSGGIDSTAIVALAKQYHPGIKTFTVGFEREGYSEIDVARNTAEKLGVENIHKLITPEAFMNELPNIIWYMDDPVADPAAIPLYFVAQEASKHVKVVLSGEGADELFGGYNIYREHLALKGFSYLPGIIKQLFKKIALWLPEGMKGKNFLLRGTTPLSERYTGNAKIFIEAEKEQLLSYYQTGNPYTAITQSLFQDTITYDSSLKMQYIDLHTWLPGDILVKADRMTMAHSLELRVPFLDKAVFDVAKAIPTGAKITKGTTKYALREAMRDLVPDSVLYRRKLGFPVPIRHWLRDELYEWVQSIIINSPTEHLIKKQEALALLEEHALHKTDNSRKIWVILVFMLWYSQYVESCPNK